MKLKSIIIVLVMAAMPGFAQKTEVALTPPMGWNSWNKFGGKISEKIIMEMADAMVSSGMKEAGYEYIVIDDLWQKGRFKDNQVTIEGRDKEGRLLVDSVKFPNGMKAVGDYIHAKGLKFGLYAGPGLTTCGNGPGSLGHEAIDVATYESWGVDFIKLDKCGFEGDVNKMLNQWRGLLDKATRPIVLSVNVGGVGYSGLPATSNMWRTTSDIMAYWDTDPRVFKIFPSVTDVIAQHEKIAIAQFPSSWNDPDMMQVGNGKLTEAENKTHFFMWALFGAPLMTGNDLRSMSPETKNIITNKEVIEINQDPLGFRGTKVADNENGVQVWAKKLRKFSDYAVVVTNLTKRDTTVMFRKSVIGLKGSFFVRDLWTRKDLGSFTDSLPLTIASHGSAMLKITANERPVPIKSITPSLIYTSNLTLKAEDIAKFEAGRYDDKIKGFNGKWYLQGEVHEWGKLEAIWKVTATAKSKCKAEIRYVNLHDQDVTYELNGQIVKLPKTPSGMWQTATVVLGLEKGSNIVVLRSSKPTENNVCVDLIRIYQ